MAAIGGVDSDVPKSSLRECSMLVVHERELQCSATRFGRTQLLLRRSSVGVGAIGKANSPWRCSQSKLSSVGVKGNSALGRVDAALTDQLMGEQLTRAAGADAQRATRTDARRANRAEA